MLINGVNCTLYYVPIFNNYGYYLCELLTLIKYDNHYVSIITVIIIIIIITRRDRIALMSRAVHTHLNVPIIIFYLS